MFLILLLLSSSWMGHYPFLRMTVDGSCIALLLQLYGVVGLKSVDRKCRFFSEGKLGSSEIVP